MKLMRIYLIISYKIGGQQNVSSHLHVMLRAPIIFTHCSTALVIICHDFLHTQIQTLISSVAVLTRVIMLRRITCITSHYLRFFSIRPQITANTGSLNYEILQILKRARHTEQPDNSGCHRYQSEKTRTSQRTQLRNNGFRSNRNVTHSTTHSHQRRAWGSVSRC